MPTVYLGQYELVETAPGVAQWQPPFAADVLGVLDLRTDAQHAAAGPGPAGYAIFAYPAPVSHALLPIEMGSVMTAAMRMAARSAVATLLGLGDPLGGATLADSLYLLLTEHADPLAVTGPRPLLPTEALRLELELGGYGMIKVARVQPGISLEWPGILTTHQEAYRAIRDAVIGGQLPPDQHRRYLGSLVLRYPTVPYADFIPTGLPDERPVRPETVVSDSFNRANSTNLGANWTEDTGDWGINSNALRLNTSGGDGRNQVIHNTALSSANHYAQCVLTGHTTFGQFRGPMIRWTDATHWYAGTLVAQGGTDNLQFSLRNGGAPSAVASTNEEWVDGQTMYVEIDGSSYKVKVNGVTKLSGTNTTLATGLKVGVWQTTQDNADRADDFLGADLGVVPPISVVPGIATLLGGRGL